MSADVRPGAQLGDFRILELVGRGGMGIVYLAEDVRLKRRAAVKVLAPELAEDETFRHRFIRESELAAAIDHPNIVPVYGAGEAGGRLWIAMRYVEGTNLRDLIARKGRLDLEYAVSVVSQIGRALDAANSRGLVHRDVKPGNILILPGAGGESTDHIYLTDFGLTKRAMDDSGLTSTGQFIGTIDFIAPEQIQGRTLDGRADQYSLACVLYTCLCGHVPFLRDVEIATIYAHLTEPPPRLSAERPDLPPFFDDVLGRAMAKDPEQRYPSCGAMVAEVRGRMAAPAPAPEGPASAPPPQGAVSALPAQTGAPATEPMPTRRSEPPPYPPARRRPPPPPVPPPVSPPAPWPSPRPTPAVRGKVRLSRNGWAVASFVFGLLGLFALFVGPVLALLFGYRALGQIKRTGELQPGRGLALAGVVLGWSWIALTAISLAMTLTRR